jgi:hypothetical protein
VQHLPLDAGLNLLWLGISASAIFWFGRLDLIRSHRLRWKRIFAVLLATVALFPAVSDSDDLFSFSRLRIPVPHHRDAGTTPEDSREKDSIQLIRLIESLDHWLLAPFQAFSPDLCLCSLLLLATVVAVTRPVFASAGRAPPAGLI